MATRDTYTKVHEEWKNDPDKTTPVLAEDLEHIEQGIKTAMDNRALRDIYGDESINLGRKAGTSVGGKSTAEGYNTVASGYGSHSEGEDTLASGAYSHAEGYNTKTYGFNCHAEGNSTIAGIEQVSTAVESAHSEGIGTHAIQSAQHVGGKYNVQTTGAVVIGGGTSDVNRKNIHTLDWQGNAVYAGDVKTGEGVSLNGIGTPETIDIDFSNYFT